MQETKHDKIWRANAEIKHWMRHNGVDIDGVSERQFVRMCKLSGLQGLSPARAYAKVMGKKK